ncbi:formylglycine-generating enzyme family protein [Botrimarina sp.]|uniref:formylglycine-generating enzyme family protein n=1 Tax=Botrimarina sp. TaxID=2795802 RepID=UPI0032EAE7A7
MSLGCTKRPAASAPQPQRFVNSLGMELVRLEPGAFPMGAAADSSPTDPSPTDPLAAPRHRVTLTKPFYIGAHEVTQGQYAEVMDVRFNHPIEPFFSKTGGGRALVQDIDTSRLPIDNVTWNFAEEFCRRISDLPEERAARRSYRLPTEAEWEYACRGGRDTSFAFGDELTLAQANFSSLGDPENALVALGRMSVVGSYPPNPFGLFDMHGNTWEWCSDGLRSYHRGDATDPVGPQNVYRVLRGGAWDTPAAFCASHHRVEALAGYVFAGFRVVCEVSDAPLDAAD